MINPFTICSVAELATLQAYADREDWMGQCWVLGATDDQARAYDAGARVYARTTPYPNSDVVAYARKLAVQALERGEGMPESAEQAVENENRRQTARLSFLWRKPHE